MGRRSLRSLARLGIALASICAGIARGDDPTVVRVQVPSSKVSRYFPPGTPISSLPTAVFEGLVDRARRAGASIETPPRILQASHEVRWAEGVLNGASSFTVERGGKRPSLAVLSPWTPAIDSRPDEPNAFRTDAGGTSGLWITPQTPDEVKARWQVRALPGSDGRIFDLSLPDLARSSLVLELPIHLTPSGIAGSRSGPTPGSTPGSHRWRFDGVRGRVALRLRDATTAVELNGTQGVWYREQVEAVVEESRLAWTVDWNVEMGASGDRRILVDLPPGQELLEVSGKQVLSHEIVETTAERTRLRVRLGEPAGPGPFAIRLKGIRAIPVSGTVPTPSASLVEATWLGATTVVRAGTKRELARVVERNGRQVPTADAAKPALTFESERPGAAAELTYVEPMNQALVSIRGVIRLGDNVPRLEARIDWNVVRGRVLEGAIDLPAAWSVERFGSLGERESVAWHTEPGRDGSQRLVWSAALAPDASRAPFELVASASGLGVLGPFEAPKVVPLRGTVVDDLWAIVPGPALSLLPQEVKGLDWVEPERVVGTTSLTIPPDQIPGTLSWRWLGDGGSARFERFQAAAPSLAQVNVDFSLEPSRVVQTWRIDLERIASDARAIPVFCGEGATARVRWRLVDGGAGRLDVKPLDGEARGRWGIPAASVGWLITLPVGSGTTARLVGEAEDAWDGNGRFAIPRLPDEFSSLNLVSVRHDPGLRPAITAQGLDRIDLLEARGREVPPVTAGTSAGVRYVASGPEPRLEIRCEPADPAVDRPLVREALLRTEILAGRTSSRLFLRVLSGGGRPLEFRMPAGVSLLQARRNGEPVSVARRGEVHEVALPGPDSAGSCTVELEYASDPSDDVPRRASNEIEPIVPGFDSACLAFTWEILAPDGVRMAGHGPDWARRGHSPDGARTASLFGTILGAVRRPRLPRLDPDEVQRRMAAIEARLSRGPGIETLGDLLFRIDGGDWPVVIDRFALMERGIGEATPLTAPAATDTAIQSLDPQLSRLGLALAPTPSALVITTASAELARQESPGGSSEAIREAARAGSDPSRSFLSIGAWLRAGSWELPLPGPGPTSRRIARLHLAGWPEPARSRVSVVDEVSERYRVGFVAAIMFLASLLIGTYSRGLAWILAVALGLVISLGVAAGAGWAIAFAPAFLPTVAATLLFWLARSFRGTASHPPGGSVAAAGPTGSHLSAPSTAVAVVCLIATAPAWAQVGPGVTPPPIVALFPYDGPPDPLRRPDRVILRLSDLKRLREMADLRDPAGPLQPLAASAVHTIQRSGDGLVAVESTFEVQVDDPAPSSWSGPVGNARDLVASVDGRPVDVALSADGGRFAIPLPGAGRHLVVIRRQVPTIVADGLRAIGLPINRVANAQVRMLPASEAEAEPVESVRSIGPWTITQNRADGRIGPEDRLEVRWSSSQPRQPERPAEFDSLILWDSVPAGDLARIRWTLRDAPTPLTSIAFRLPAGERLRSSEIPGVVDLRSEDDPRSGTIWKAKVDPPLTRGARLQVEVWRPAAPTTGGRILPAAQLVGAGSPAGSVAFRRPPYRTGRLAGAGEATGETVEESFVKAWGELPSDGLTLAGVAPLKSDRSLTVETGPPSTPRRVTTKAVVGLDNGRLVSRMECALQLERGITGILRFRIDPDFDLWRIQSDRVSRWMKVGPGLYEFQITPANAVENVQILGSLAVAPDALDHQVRRYSASLPWPSWDGLEDAGGEFTVAGAKSYQVEPPASEARTSFAARPGGSPRKLIWSSEPPRVDVEIANRLLLSVDRASWTAYLRFRVLGGPLDLIYLELPGEWAKDASVELLGIDRQLTAETRGESTYWAVRPSHPVWGQALMVLRGSVPVQAGTTFSAPRLIPRGKGGVKSTLGLWNASGRRLVAEGSQGLDEIDATGLIAAPEAPRPIAEPNMAFRINSDQWGLKFQVGPARYGLAGTVVAKARRGSFAVAARADGGILGESTFDLVPRSGEEFQLRFPSPARVVWAGLGDVPLASTLSREGVWRASLPDQINGPLRVVWASDGQAHPGSIRLPGHSQPELPLLGIVGSPEGSSWSVGAGAIERVQAVTFPYQQIEAGAERLAELIATTTDFSDAGKMPLLLELIRIELAYRHLLRADDPVADGTLSRDALVERAKLRLEQIRQNLDAAGLSDVWENCQWRSGLTDTTPQRLREPIAGRLIDPGRPAVLGDRSRYLADGPTEIRLDPVPAEAERGDSPAIALLDSGSLLLLGGLGWGLLRAAGNGRRWVWIPRVTVAIGLAAASIAWPQMIPLAIALVLVGRSMD